MGVSVPSSVRVVEVPPTLIDIYPEWRGHQYFVVNDDIVIVDRSRKIVATPPMSSSPGGAAQVDRGGGGAQSSNVGDLVDLGPDEIRQVQIVLKEKGLYRGEPDGVLGTATTQALIAFQRRSPRAWWYWRASFHADSTASEPPETKKTRFRSPGARLATSCASSIARGWAYDQLV